MDGKLTPPDVMEKTMVMSDVNEAHLTEDLFSSGTQKDSTACPTGSRNSQIHLDPNEDVNRALPIYVPWCGKNDPPQHPPALLPICNKPRANEKTQLYSSTNRGRLKTTSCTDQTLNDACLFCNPLDCLFATLTGCHACTLSLCSYLCGCQPTTLVPLLNTRGCCCSSDCNGCNVRLPATECIDLAMEFSQMVFH